MRGPRSGRAWSPRTRRTPTACPVMNATLPSMKSKILAQIMMKPASTNWSVASAQPAAQLMSTPISVSVFGEMPSATLARMMARSGNMQIVPTVPVNVIVAERYNERFDEQPKSAP